MSLNLNCDTLIVIRQFARAFAEREFFGAVLAVATVTVFAVQSLFGGQYFSATFANKRFHVSSVRRAATFMQNVFSAVAAICYTKNYISRKYAASPFVKRLDF